MAVTGASGMFGRAAVDELLDRMPARDIIAITRSPERLRGYADRGVEVRFGDFDDRESISSAARGVDSLLLISTVLVGQRVPQHEAAIAGAIEAAVSHIAYTSYTGTEPNPSLAVIDHRATEEMLVESGVDWTVLRNSQYSEAVLDAIAPGVLAEGRWVTSTADGTLANVTRNDCVRAAVAVLAGDGERNRVYEITGSELSSFRRIAGMLSEITGRQIDIVDVDDEGLYEHFDAMGIPRSAYEDGAIANIPWCSDDMVSVERSIREGCMAVCTDDVKKLTGIPATSLREYLHTHSASLRAHLPRGTRSQS